MSRAGSSYKGEAASAEISPILLVRALDIPAVNNPSVKVSLYLTGNQSDVTFFNENDASQLYTACALSYDQVKASTDNEIGTVSIRLDNVSGTFTSLAKDYVLRGVRVQLLEAFEDTLASPAGARYLFEGHIERPMISISAIEVLVKADFSLSVRVPRRLYWIRDFPHLPSSKDPRQVFTK
jgi:hypothetical protein